MLPHILGRIKDCWICDYTFVQLEMWDTPRGIYCCIYNVWRKMLKYGLRCEGNGYLSYLTLMGWLAILWGTYKWKRYAVKCDFQGMLNTKRKINLVKHVEPLVIAILLMTEISTLRPDLLQLLMIVFIQMQLPSNIQSNPIPMKPNEK